MKHRVVLPHHWQLVQQVAADRADEQNKSADDEIEVSTCSETLGVLRERCLRDDS